MCIRNNYKTVTIGIKEYDIKHNRNNVYKILTDNNIQCSYREGVKGETLDVELLGFPLFNKNKLGCNLAHLRVWLELLTIKEDYLFIIENDIEIDLNVFEFLNNYEFPIKPDILYLGVNTITNPLLINEEIVQINNGLGNFGYLINKKVAQEAIHLLTTKRIYNDNVFNVFLNKKYKTFATIHQYCKHVENISTAGKGINKLANSKIELKLIKILPYKESLNNKYLKYQKTYLESTTGKEYSYLNMPTNYDNLFCKLYEVVVKD